MNDRRSDDTGSEGERSWEEFLRNLRREESGASDDEGRATRPPADEASPGEGRPSAAGAGGQDPQTARVVVPPETEEFEGTRRRRRHLLIGGAATLALLIGGFLLYDQVVAGGNGGPAATGNGAAAERPDTAVAMESPRAPDGAEERSARFAARADSLAEAIASFRERRRDFDLGRIGCEGLARGLRAVQSAFAGLRGIAGADGARLAPPARERFGRLVEDVRSVEDAFSESECSGSP